MAQDQHPDGSRPQPILEPVERQGVFSKELRRMVADLVLETTPEAIWLIDAEARTTFVNHRLAEMLGYREEEMVGRYIFEFMDRERWRAAQRNLSLRQQGVEGRREIELVRKDGSRVWVLGSGNPIFDRDGRYAGALAVFGDLSEQKQREQALRAQLSEVQARLAAGGPSGARSPAPLSERRAPTYREPFRTAIVLGVLGTIFATVAVTTVGAVAAGFISGDDHEEA